MSDLARMGGIPLKPSPAGHPVREAPIRPAASPNRGTDDVSRAIDRAARRTGVDFDYLLATARKESALDPEAKARTSSATGLYQFIDQTWLSVLKDEGANHGYGAYAEAITGRRGRYTVAPDDRAAVMALRRDPEAAAAMAAELTRRNADALRASLGRAPVKGELYVAHVMGARGAARLITLAERNPSAPAAEVFPRAAAANKAIFYSKGAPRGAADVVGFLTHGLSDLPNDGSAAVREARAAASTWRAMTDRLGGIGQADRLDERPAGLVPRVRLDAIGATRAYGRIGALSQ